MLRVAQPTGRRGNRGLWGRAPGGDGEGAGTLDLHQGDVCLPEGYTIHEGSLGLQAHGTSFDAQHPEPDRCLPPPSDGKQCRRKGEGSGQECRRIGRQPDGPEQPNRPDPQGGANYRPTRGLDHVVWLEMGRHRGSGGLHLEGWGRTRPVLSARLTPGREADFKEGIGAPWHFKLISQ